MNDTGYSNPKKVELGSPQWLIDKINTFSDGVFSKYLKILVESGKFNAFNCFYFFILGLIFYFNLDLLFDIASKDYYFNYILRWAPIILITCFLSSLFRLFKLEFSSSIYIFFIILNVFGKGLWFLYKDAPLGFVLDIAMSLSFFVLLDLMNWYSKKKAKLPRFSFLIVGFYIILVIRWCIEHYAPASAHLYRNIFVTERLILPLAIFWSEGTRIVNPISYFSFERLKQLFLPFNLFFPLPAEQKILVPVTDSRLDALRLKGLCDFSVSIIFLILYIVLKNFEGDVLNLRSSGIKLPTLGLIFYLQLFFKSSWFFRIATGYGRILGFNLYDSFNFGLLAVSPIERWTRWSIYYNKWLREFIYFPLMIRTRQIFIPLFATFLFSFVLHSYTHFLRFGSEFLHPLNMFQWRSKLVYYTLQMLLLYFSVKYIKIWPSGQKRSGWCGVVITMMLMMGVHLCVYLAI